MDRAFFDEVTQRITANTVVSFDIFGTLLLRPFRNPKNVFQYIEDSFKLEGFCSKRIAAEKKAQAEFGRDRVRYDQIYDHLPEYSRQIELDTEEQILFRNADILELFEFAVDHAKAVVLISDMYLPKAYIQRVLKKNGITRYNELYVSSEFGKSKASGELYGFVMDDMGIQKEELIHIGDDLNSDVYVPQKAKIKAYRYDNPSELYFSKYPYRKKSSPDWCEDLFVQLSSYRSAIAKDSYWERIGYEIGGPVCFSYLSWILNCVENRKEHTTDIAFVARDGYLLKKYFDVLMREKKTDLVSHYVYVPRSLTIIFELQKHGSDVDFPQHYFDSVYDFYRSALPAQCQNYTADTAREWLSENIGYLKPLIEQDCREYTDYIQNEHFGSGDILLVDSITEGFSAQKLLEDALEKKVSGLYWVVLKSHKHLECITYQAENYHLLLSWMIVEFILSSPAPSVKSIRNLKPVYNETPYELQRQAIFSELEKGIECFFQDLCAVGMENSRIPERSIRHYFNDFCQNGTKEDIRQFSALKYSRKLDHSDEIEINPFAANSGSSFKRFLAKVKREIVLHPKLYFMLKSVKDLKKRG